MLSRTIRRSLIDAQPPCAVFPPTFLLPSRARYFNSTPQHVESPPPQSLEATQRPPTAPHSLKRLQTPPQFNTRVVPQPPPPPSEPLILSSSIKELLPALTLQPSHYITVHIHGKPYLVTLGDSIRLPFHMPGVVPGDVLRLNRATTLGSRDYTMKGAPYLDERMFECRAVVIGTESEPMRIKTKTKRRQRKIKSVKSKHKHTVLKIADLKIKTLEEIEGSV